MSRDIYPTDSFRVGEQVLDAADLVVRGQAPQKFALTLRDGGTVVITVSLPEPVRDD